MRFSLKKVKNERTKQIIAEKYVYCLTEMKEKKHRIEDALSAKTRKKILIDTE
jgi:hypothetical protein